MVERRVGGGVLMEWGVGAAADPRRNGAQRRMSVMIVKRRRSVAMDETDRAHHVMRRRGDGTVEVGRAKTVVPGHAAVNAARRARWHKDLAIRSQRARGSHAFFLLLPVAKPDANDLLFELKALRQGGDLLGTRFWLLHEMVLERPFDGHFYGRPLLSFPALSRDFVDGRRRSRRRVRFLQPLLKQRFQFAHVLE